ncbi:MAG: putative glycoside hydrolase [Bacillota bacterium]|nr:putative glycoside hydrolase [Bacillota bacterium]
MVSKKTNNKKKKKLSKKMKRRIRLIELGTGFLAIVVLFCFLVVSLFQFIFSSIHPTKYIKCPSSSLTTTQYTKVDGELEKSYVTLTRGTKVSLKESGSTSSVVSYDGLTLRVPNENLVNSLEEVVECDYVYPRRLANLQKEKDGPLEEQVVRKGDKVKVIGTDVVDFNEETGILDYYEVEIDGENYFLRGDYCESSAKAAAVNYAEDITYSTFWDEYFGEGYSEDAYISQVDYKPTPKVNYESNPMPEQVDVMHVNLFQFIEDKDYYMGLKDRSGINAFALEVKDDYGFFYYDSAVPKNYLKEPQKALNTSQISRKGFKNLIQEFQDAGYYMIGRIVTFKDLTFASQNPEAAITDKKTGELFLHNDEYWPSAYSRKAWMYNVDVAKELADLGFNEIQFDYVRFPDGTVTELLDGHIDLKNKYEESKAAALQGFLMYAKEELKKYEVYVAADVFAWPVVAGDDQDTGQFFPAIANVVDVIDPMPYMDHFAPGAMGFDEPTEEPGPVMYTFSTIVKQELSHLKTPAIYRTWIQGYDMEPKGVRDQIEAINEAGFKGYMVWYGVGLKGDIENIIEGCISG